MTKVHTKLKFLLIFNFFLSLLYYFPRFLSNFRVQFIKTRKFIQKVMKKRPFPILIYGEQQNTNNAKILLKAEEIDASEFPVIVLKGAKVGDFAGRSLSVTGQTVVRLNPDIPEAHAIRGWFDQGGNEAPTENLSVGGGQGGSGGGAMTGPQAWKTLDSIKDSNMGQSEKGDYFSVKGVVLYAKKDNSMYMACPGENCNKKVVDQNDGTYRCEKCQKNYQEFKWRMILNVGALFSICLNKGSYRFFEKCQDYQVDFGQIM